MTIASRPYRLLQALLLALGAALSASHASAQRSFAGPVPSNPTFEAGRVGKAPPDWWLSAQGSCSCKVIEGDAFQGNRAAFLDSSNSEFHEQSQLSQTIDARPWRGKRLKYCAAVKSVEVGGGVGSPIWWLWCKVERPRDADGKMQQGATDMGRPRPIKNSSWEIYEIVLDVAADATQVTLGMGMTGRGKVWFDAVKLEAVDASVEITTPRGVAPIEGTLSAQFAKDPASRQAEAMHAQQQPFWTTWLIVALVASSLFVLGMWPLRRLVDGSTENNDVVAAYLDDTGMGRLRYFALRFTFVYWLLFFLPEPVTTMFFMIARLLDAGSDVQWLDFMRGWSDPLYWFNSELVAAHRDYTGWLSGVIAEGVFDERSVLVPPSRESSDTTMGYLLLLGYVGTAAVVAVAWTTLMRQRPSRNTSVDLLRSFLRYALAFALFASGLAKLDPSTTPFPELTGDRLDVTWGATSPMELVWGFMSASRPYTVFVGVAESTAAVLLLSRHTALLGAMISMITMANVMMLNFCYDLPQKILSTHLMLGAAMIVVPDVRRLASLLLNHRNSKDPGTASYWSVSRTPYMRWLPKGLIIACCFLPPVAERVWTLFTVDTPVQAPLSDRGDRLLVERGFRWVNEYPLNR